MSASSCGPLEARKNDLGCLGGQSNVLPFDLGNRRKPNDVLILLILYFFDRNFVFRNRELFAVMDL